MNILFKAKRFGVLIAAAVLMQWSVSILAQDTIKVGVLHSLSGSMAISETTLKDTVLMMVEEQNRAGGLLGRQLEAVVVDPASDWPLFAEQTRELITQEGVDVIFGCWTSVSRKSVLPVALQSPFESIWFYSSTHEDRGSLCEVSERFRVRKI